MAASPVAEPEGRGGGEALADTRDVPAAQGADVVNLLDFSERGLSERQREVLRRVRAGADCPMCGDLGAVVDPECGTPNAGKPAACMACGRVGEAVDPRAEGQSSKAVDAASPAVGGEDVR